MKPNAQLRDYNIALNEGLVPGHSPIVKFGYNSDIDSAAEETIWAAGGEYTQESGAETVNIVSTSVDDASGGTGCQYILIDGVDNDWNKVSEYAWMDGSGTVTTTTEFRGINRVAGALFGTGQKNAGAINITQSSSGLTLAYIPVGESITQQCIYHVPTGYTAFLREMFVNVTKTSAGTDPLAEVEIYSYNSLSNGIYNLATFAIDANHTNSIILSSPYALPSSEKTVLYLNVNTDQNNTKAYARFFMSLVNNNVLP